jgi:hypothetical protein
MKHTQKGFDLSRPAEITIRWIEEKVDGADDIFESTERTHAFAITLQDFYNDMVEINGPDTEANAKLIAAAPELLEALKKSFEAMKEAYNGGQSLNYIDLSQAEEAIKKAIS